VELSFPQGLGEADIKSARAAVQGEAARVGLTAQQGFTLLFVMDELLCNVMEHAQAASARISLQANSAGFRLTLLDDGSPFDVAGEARKAAGDDLRGAEDRRLGLSLVGRLVDQIEYRRTPAGQNLVELAKDF
jgi:anti-sigma regulatory factor (Ser/Thr protein kinase)